MGSWISVGGVPVYVDDTGAPSTTGPGGQSIPLTPTPAAPVAQPGSPVPKGPPVQSESAGASDAQRGGYNMSSVALDPKIYGAVEGADRRILQQQPAILQQQQAQLAPRAAGEQQIAQDASQANYQQTQALAGQADAQAAGDRAIADLNTRFAAAEESGRKIAAARAASYRASYETQLRQWAASGVQVPDTGIAGAVTAFVTDFLGARGIHSSGLDLLNQAVDRSVQTQLDNMRHGGEVTQEFRSLWQAALAEGDSESEARAKIFGYHLAGAQSQVAAEVAKYGGPLAQAQGQAAQAQIEEELQTHLAGIQDMAYQRAQDQIKTMLDTEHQAQQLSIQRSSVGAQWYNAQTERMKVENAKAADPHLMEKITDLNSRIITDPRDPNHLLGAAHTKEQADKLRENLPKWTDLQENLAKARDMINNVSMYLGPGHTMTNSQYEQMVEGLWTDALTDYAYLKSGAQYSDAFLGRLEKAMPLKGWSNNPDVMTTYSQLIDKSIDNADRSIHTQAAPLVGWEKDLVANGLVSGVGSNEPTAAARKEDVTIAQQKDHGVTPPGPVDAAEQLLTGRRSQETVGDAALTQEAVAAGIAEQPPKDVPLQYERVPAWVEGLHDLFNIAASKDSNPDDVADARKALYDFATTQGTPDQQVMANYYLAHLDTPPDTSPSIAPAQMTNPFQSPFQVNYPPYAGADSGRKHDGSGQAPPDYIPKNWAGK